MRNGYKTKAKDNSIITKCLGTIQDTEKIQMTKTRTKQTIITNPISIKG